MTWPINCSQPDWDGAAATCTLDNLEGQTEYYFVVRAFDGGIESADSTEAHYNPPVMDNDGDGTYSWRVRFFDSGGRASAWSARANFTTQAADDDLDGNGISDDQEGGVGQAHVTRSLSSPTITCEPTALVVASETIVAEIEQMALIDPNDLEIDETTPDRLPSAMLAYKLVLYRLGQRALVTIKLSDPAPAGATWIKYDAVR